MVQPNIIWKVRQCARGYVYSVESLPKSCVKPGRSLQLFKDACSCVEMFAAVYRCLQLCKDVCSCGEMSATV